MSATYTRNLVAEQYGVLASSQPCTFLVIKPAGAVYETNPVRRSCTCAAGQKGRPCCHLAQLRDLLQHDSRRKLALSETIDDARHEAQIVGEVEALVAKWKEVKTACQTPPSAASRLALSGQPRNNAWVLAAA